MHLAALYEGSRPAPRRDRGQSFEAIVARSGVELSQAKLWALMHIVIRRRASAGNEAAVADGLLLADGTNFTLGAATKCSADLRDSGVTE